MTKQGAIDYFVARKENGERLLCNKTRKAEDWAIKALQSYQEWVSVKDRLPELYKEVLAFTNYREVVVYSLIQTSGEEPEFFWEDDCGNWNGDGIDAVTHWMPIPEPPKEKGVGQ